MTRFALTTTALVLSTTAAVAGPVDVPPPPPPVYVEEERCGQSFDCFYVGLEYGLGQADITRNDLQTVPVPLTFDPEGSVWGGFAGYNVQNGSLVYGGEVRMLHFIDVSVADFEVDDVIDIRGRIGVAASEDLLLYAAAGYSTANATAGGVDVDLDGFNFGAGIEYNVTERFFVGADFTAREVEGETPVFSYDGSLNTATLRIGFRF